ncbi:MAG: FAD-linked oxidase C-terminal domain-containing protein [Desulfuromonadales bacterium]
MLDKAIVEKLERLAGKENVLTSKVDMVAYSYDATADMPHQLPDVVVMPTGSEMVQQIVNLARSNRIAIYPRGAGSNLSGGTIPLKKGIVLSFQRMNKILEIDPANLTATVQPGVVIAALNSAVAEYGLIYPPDPGTVATATMGGSAAENSGGLRGLKYGVTKNYIMGMEVVLANGEKVKFGGKTVKNVTAYDFSNLFVGSEGTLGITTELICKLIPAPKFRRTMMGIFSTLEDAGNAVAGIIAAQVIPATLEIMDNKTIRTVEDFAKIGLPIEAKALLLCEVDGMSEDVVNAEFEAVIAVLKVNNSEYKVAHSDAERDQLWTARRNALPALASLNNTVIVEDATVPRSRITEMLVACENIAAKYNVVIGTFGHAGDGNLHPTILYDMYDKGETARVHEAIDEIFATALALDGTLSGEHGIGMAKMKYLGNELGRSGLNLMRSIKESLDPEYILNPGKMVPLREV